MTHAIAAILLCTAMLLPAHAAAQLYDREPDTFYPTDEQVQAALDRFLSMPKRAAFQGTYKPDEIAAERQKLADNPEYARQYRASADYWVEQSDETIRAMIPGGNPRMLVPSYDLGCPLHLGGIATMQPIWGKPNHYRCMVGGEEWGPGMQVQNPGTGQTVTITDDGYGWEAPEGFPNPGRYYFVAAYRLSLIKMLFSRPYRDFLDFDGYNYARPSVWCTAYTYALTEDPRYAHKTLVMLTALADIYRNCNSLHNWRNYTARAYITDHNFECNIIRQCLDAYDFIYDSIEQNEEILQWFTASRDEADLNADGVVNHRDIKHHIERNLFAFMYEFLHRAISIGRGNTRSWQLTAMIEMAVAFGHDHILGDALDGRYGLRQMFTNSFYRDGRFYEDSTGYSLGVNNTYLRIGEYLIKFNGQNLYPEGLDPEQVFGRRYANITNFVQRIASAARVPSWGDTGNPRTPVFHPRDHNQPSELFGDIGYSIMRSPGASDQQLHLLLNFAQSGAGHGHLDQLMLMPIRWGYNFSADLGYPHNLRSPKRNEWVSNTITHCTVVMDEMGQRTGSTGNLDLYADADWLQVTAAWSDDAYESASLYHRTSAIVSMSDDAHYIVDIFRVQGGQRRDYTWHSISGPDGRNFQLGGAAVAQPPQPVVGTLAGPEVEFMADTGRAYADSMDDQPDRKSGYSYITDLQKTSADGDWWCRWQVGDEHDTGLAMWMAGAEGRQLYTGRGEANGPPGGSEWDAYIIARDDTDATGSDSSVFCAVYEPFCGSPRIQSVSWLQLKQASEFTGMPVAVEVQTPEGVFVVFSSLQREPLYEFIGGEHGAYDFQGRFHAMRNVTDGDLQTVSVDLPIDQPLEGTVTALDFDAPAVTVTASAPLPEGDKLAGQPIIFEDDAWLKNAVYRIASIQPTGNPDEYRIELDEPGFETAAGTVDEVNTQEGWLFTKDSLEKLFNCHRLYDGKALYRAELDDWFHIETARAGYYSVGDVTIRLTDPAAASHFRPGERFFIMEVNPGARFRINRVVAAFG